ncbi:MAG: type VI secretion system protein ImpG [Phenylobacterium sp.]|jgi:type VI secretion system protein ImpG
MAVNQYFQDELKYLRELGKEFSEQNPGLSKFLSSQGDDPDVERLFEGFAFLTGRIRQKLDDELPEITHSLINLLWPNYLSPVPCMSILQFEAIEQALSVKQTIPRDCEVESVKVEGTDCKFKSCYDVDMYPISVSDAKTELRSHGAVLDLSFELDAGVASDAMGLDYLRLYLHCDQDRAMAQGLYLWLFNYLETVELSVYIGGRSKPQKTTLPASCIKPVGFEPEQALLPGDNSTFSGYRLIQEYFQLPEKFLFFDITEISELLQQKKIERFSFRFTFSRQFDQQVRVSKDDFRLFCTPIVNLYQGSAEPVRIAHQQQDYMLRPQYKNLQHVEIFSVEEVTGRIKGNPTLIDYPSFESFEHEVDKSMISERIFHKIVRKPSVLEEGMDTHISFVSPIDRHVELRSETISVTLMCTNRRLAETLRVGEICHDTGTSPGFAQFKNITQVTPALSPPLQGGLHWRLIANMALHYHSLASVDALRVLLRYYDFKAFTDRQAQRTNQQMMKGIEDIKVQNVDRIFKGIPVRGLKTTLSMRESQFGSKGHQGEASMYQFACVLNGYFKQYAQLNTFHRLEVKGLESGETYLWEPKRWGQ